MKNESPSIIRSHVWDCITGIVENQYHWLFPHPQNTPPTIETNYEYSLILSKINEIDKFYGICLWRYSWLQTSILLMHSTNPHNISRDNTLI